jgi:diguanylate cyclase (GGDEF)-like protein
MIMFINYKIFDKNYHFLGATGVGLKISYIDEMLGMFKEKYKLHVSFLDKNGRILFSDNSKYLEEKQLDSIPSLNVYRQKILSKNTSIIEYKKDSSRYILNTKYIPELNAYLLVEAKLDDFTSETKQTFYLSLALSLLLTLIIAIMIIEILKGFNKRLEKLASNDSLTSLANRRSFTYDFEKILLLSERSEMPISLLFIDIDNFKSVNDVYGHDTGDLILKEFATLLKANIRETDLCARWGGEEVVVGFINSSSKEAFFIAEKIREASAQNEMMLDMLGKPLTISAGLADAKKGDTLDSIISRADTAMYEAKTKGKNRVHLLSE